MVSNMLKRLPNYQPADLTQFTGFCRRAGLGEGWSCRRGPDRLSEWKLLPNSPITRAEALVTILKLLRALGW